MRRRVLTTFALALVSALVPALAVADPIPDEGEEDGRPIPSASASSASARSASSSLPGAAAAAPLSSASGSAAASATAKAGRVAIESSAADHDARREGMVLVPGGRFAMGAAASDKTAAPNERPAHTEIVPPFYIDKLEVTVEAYHLCVDKHLCAAPAKTSALCTYDLGDPALPVSCVRWSDANAYCRSVQKRLPREAEWEFAARGTSNARYPWGGVPACSLAATLLHESTGRSCTGKRPARVGTHPQGASPFGVQDMSGNVEEWTQDFYVEHIAEGAAPRSGASHVIRGGGWLSAPSLSKTTSRDWGSSLEAGPNIGFRCAKDKDAP